MKYWDRAWNPVQGCKKCSEGCDNCFAESLLRRKGIDADFADVRINRRQLSRPFDTEPELIFICSQSDLFQDEVPDNVIDGVIRKCANCASKRFLTLTKRADRLREYFSRDGIVEKLKGLHLDFDLGSIAFGVTVEGDRHIGRIDALRDTQHITSRFVAFEPLLSRIDVAGRLHGIDWVVVGCESGDVVRYCDPEWIKGIIAEADNEGIPVFVNNVNIDGQVISEFSELPAIFHRDENPFAV